MKKLLLATLAAITLFSASANATCTVDSAKTQALKTGMSSAKANAVMAAMAKKSSAWK